MTGNGPIEAIEHQKSLIGRAWTAWCRFWFTPADPTPLCLMRIVVGLLVLYVHVAYTFDLHALFGADGWSPIDTANRERWEWPVFLPPNAWEPKPAFRMPEVGDERHALRVFIDNLARDRAAQEKVFILLGGLPGDSDGWLPTLQFFRKLPTDPADREAVLRELVAAAADDEAARRRFGPFVLSLKPEEREQFRANAFALGEVLPADAEVRRHLFDLLMKEGPNGVNVLVPFVRHVTEKYPSEKERREYLDYTEYWTAPPDDKEIHHKGHVVYSPFYHVTDPRAINFLHGIHLAIIILFTLGVCTRVTSVMTWLSTLAYIQRNPISLFGQDTMMNLCVFYLMFAPCGATWSVDWLINRYRAGREAIRAGRKPPIETAPRPMVSANVVIRLIQINYCLMYMSAGLAKLKGDSWWRGTAVWYTMTNPEFSPLHIGAFRTALIWLCQDENRWLWESYMNVMNIFTLTLEIGFPFLVWTRLRPIFVFGAILLHLGIALNMGLIMFSLFMFALLLAWMSPSAIRGVFARPPSRLPKVEVRFAGRDRRQLRAAAGVYAADVWNQVELTDRAAADRPVEVVTDGESATGLQAARRLARALGMTQPPIAWLLWLPGFSQLAAALFGGRGEITLAAPVLAGRKRH
jgi:hypothetical protein